MLFSNQFGLMKYPLENKLRSCRILNFLGSLILASKTEINELFKSDACDNCRISFAVIGNKTRSSYSFYSGVKI